MCDIGKIRHITNEAAPQKAYEFLKIIEGMVLARKFRPMVKVRVKRKDEDRL